MMQDKLSADGELKRLHMERTKRLKQEIKELKEKRQVPESNFFIFFSSFYRFYVPNSCLPFHECQKHLLLY